MFTFGHETPRKVRCEGTAWAFSGKAYAASFVTRECAASLACDPTIFISCQS